MGSSKASSRRSPSPARSPSPMRSPSPAPSFRRSPSPVRSPSLASCRRWPSPVASLRTRSPSPVRSPSQALYRRSPSPVRSPSRASLCRSPSPAISHRSQHSRHSHITNNDAHPSRSRSPSPFQSPSTHSIRDSDGIPSPLSPSTRIRSPSIGTFRNGYYISNSASPVDSIEPIEPLGTIGGVGRVGGLYDYVDGMIQPLRRSGWGEEYVPRGRGYGYDHGYDDGYLRGRERERDRDAYQLREYERRHHMHTQSGARTRDARDVYPPRHGHDNRSTLDLTTPHARTRDRNRDRQPDLNAIYRARSRARREREHAEAENLRTQIERDAMMGKRDKILRRVEGVTDLFAGGRREREREVLQRMDRAELEREARWGSGRRCRLAGEMLEERRGGGGMGKGGEKVESGVVGVVDVVDVEGGEVRGRKRGWRRVFCLR